MTTKCIKCGCVTTPGEKYCKDCYTDTLKDPVSKNIYAGGRFFGVKLERRNMREQIAEYLGQLGKNWDAYTADINVPKVITYQDAAAQIIDLIYGKIEKGLLSDEELAGLSNVFPEGFTGRVGAMIAQAQIQKTLDSLRPKAKYVACDASLSDSSTSNPVGNAEV